MFNKKIVLAMFVLAPLVLAGCEVIIVENGPHPDDDRTGPPPEHVLPRQLNIPPGHHPPPGECRIWYPNRPAGQQPPPGSCYELKRNVPRNAWLIRRIPGKQNVRVSRYHPHKTGVIVEIHIYDLETGALKVDVK